MTTINSNTVKALDAQVVAGIQKHLLTVPSLPLAGTAYTPADLVKLVQSRLDSAGAVASASATWHSTVAAHGALNAKLTQVLRGLRQYVLNAFGETSPVLADFGFTPPKVATRTPEEKAAAAAKALATRRARHTMGKKQKKNVKGTAPAAAPATSTTASEPIVASGPVASAPSQGTGAVVAPRST